MSFKRVTGAVLGCMVIAGPAFASNDMILLNPDDLSNSAVIEVTGEGNRLVIEQVLVASGPANVVQINITGDRNGGPAGSLFSGAATRNGLEPGHISQNGSGNFMQFAVQGSDNLFAALQVGNNNTVQASIIGYGNQSSVSQIGNGNFASFSQNGMGNTVSVRQNAW